MFRKRLFERLNRSDTDPEVSVMKQQFASYWESKGAEPQMIENGLKMADKWARSNANFSHPDPQIRKQIISNIYPKAIESANNWMTSMRS